MTYLVAVLVSLALLIAFGVLTEYETRQGIRFFAAGRSRFDKSIEHIEFIVEHVDLLAFVREEVRHGMNYLAHQIAHLSLQVVRIVERLLTRIVRHFRTRADDDAPRESTREFVKTLSDFKGSLKETHPDVSVHDVE